MADRDVETIRSRAKFVATLRRVADAIERKEPVRIQVAAKRFVVPVNALLSFEHEVEGSNEELELQMKWQSSADTPAKPPSAAPARKRAKRKARKAARR